MADLEVGTELLDDFIRAIDVFAFNEPLVGLTVALLEQALGRDAPSQRIRQAALAGDDDGQRATVLVAHSPHLAHGDRQIRKMLEHMNRQDPLEELIIERQRLLTISREGVDPRKSFSDLGAHVLAQFESVVVALLFEAELLVFEMSADAGADLQGPAELFGPAPQRIAVIE